jgi:hypothetical protein
MKTQAHNNSRRAFIGASAAVAAATLMPGAVRVLRAEGDQPKAEEAAPVQASGAGKLKHLIIISLVGGPSHMDLFDPKTDPAIKGEFAPLETEIDGLSVTEVLPGIAKRAQHLCMVNSMTSGEGNHDRGRYLTLTGHVPNPSVRHPTLGSMIAKEFENDVGEMPAFVSVGGATIDAGYLGPRYSALTIADPERGLENLAYRTGVTPEQERQRLEKRLKLRDAVDESFRRERSAAIAADQRAMYTAARRLMDSKRAEAFDISNESSSARESYGRTRFGQGLLLARRLVETGVKCVEVRLGGWDTHSDNFNRVRNLAAQLDIGISNLIDDLQQRERFEDTAIACYGEFGRTPRINSGNGRDHFPRAWSMLLAGGPFARGRVVGKTNEQASAVIERPVTVPDYFVSMAHACGFDPLRRFEVSDRPIWYTDKAGKIVPELFA